MGGGRIGPAVDGRSSKKEKKLKSEAELAVCDAAVLHLDPSQPCKAAMTGVVCTIWRYHF